MASKSAPIPEPLSAAEVKKLDYVDDGDNYYVTIQMGGARSWRQWSGQKRKATQQADGTYLHPRYIPTVHENIGPFSGRILNGLIGEHNEWVTAFNRKDGWAGQVDRQLVVLDIQKTSDLPQESQKQAGTLSAFSSMIEGIVKQQINEVIGTGA